MAINAPDDTSSPVLSATESTTPLTGEEMENAIRELPRDPETVALYKKMAEQGPLPPR